MMLIKMLILFSLMYEVMRQNLSLITKGKVLREEGV